MTKSTVAAFTVEEPDFDTNPHTGMGRRHWLSVFRYVLEGAFSHIEDPDAPLVFPCDANIGVQNLERDKLKMNAECFEGLARPFFYGAALINEEPGIELCGHSVRDYYARQILLATNPEHPNYIGHPDWMTPITEDLIPVQPTVECAALILSLWQCKAHLWDRYEPAEQKQVAEFLSAWGHARTGNNNWHFFNVLVLSFLKDQGLSVDEDILLEHLNFLLSWYVGDGWYRDGGNFTNYSHWAFQYYAAVWCHWYGHKHHPEITAVLRDRHAVMMQSMHRFFGREGQSILWTRSAPYRYAASAVLTTGFLWDNPTDDSPGWSRRIASGNMLQFITRPDVYKNRIPSLGFYRQFAPATENYSCPASVFWCGKNTTAMLLPEDSPFWTEIENEGIWSNEPVAETLTLPGPGLALINDSRSGTTEIRPGKVPQNQPGDLRLGFNSHFPWESHGGKEHIRSQTYSFKQHDTDKPYEEAIRTHYVGMRKGVLHRMMVLLPMRSVIDLAEIPTPGGVIRLDRIRISFPYDLRLSHYGLPFDPGEKYEKETMELDGYSYVRTKSSHGELYLGAIHGWDSLYIDKREGSNPVTEESLMPVAATTRPKLYGGYMLGISVLLANASTNPFGPDEIQPIADLEIVPLPASGAPMGCQLSLKDGRQFNVDFANVEGVLTA